MRGPVGRAGMWARVRARSCCIRSSGNRFDQSYMFKDRFVFDALLKSTHHLAPRPPRVGRLPRPITVCGLALAGGTGLADAWKEAGPRMVRGVLLLSTLLLHNGSASGAARGGDAVLGRRALDAPLDERSDCDTPIGCAPAESSAHQRRAVASNGVLF